MRELAGLQWKDQDVTTVGGYIVRRLGNLPRVGEQVRVDGYIATVEQADDRRVQQLRFQRTARTKPAIIRPTQGPLYLKCSPGRNCYPRTIHRYRGCGKRGRNEKKASIRLG
jgi:Transporter associated domain